MSLATLECERPDRSTPNLAATIRVLHVINGEHFAGAERVQDLLAIGLPDSGVDVEFVCLKPVKFPERRASSVPLHELPMRSRWDLPRAAKCLAALVREGRFSLLHTHTTRNLLIGRAASLMTGVPLVHHVHSRTDTEIGQKWATRVNVAIERACLRGARAVIAVSSSTEAYARTLGLAPPRLTRIPNGIAATRAPEEKPLRSGDSTWTLGTVALFRPRKGLEVLLDAVAQLRQRGHAVRLRAVGPFETPAYEQEVKQRCAQLGIVQSVDWTGFTRDVARELAQMDLFVFPSVIAEGMPMVLLEAMAAGAPIVASRVEGVPDVLRENVDALLVAPGDVGALVDAVAHAMCGSCDLASLRESARRRQASEFSARGMSQRVASIYREVLAR